jgi:hypothetical protein
MSNEKAYELALQQVRRHPDGSINEDKLIEALVANIVFDTDAAKLGLARRIIADKKRLGRTPADGQLVLPIDRTRATKKGGSRLLDVTRLSHRTEAARRTAQGPLATRPR